MFKKSSVTRIKRRLKAARALSKRKDPVAHFLVFNNLVSTRLTKLSSPSCEITLDQFEICVRQRLVQSLMANGFLGELSVCAANINDPITAPLPREWLLHLEVNGFLLNKAKSRFLWQLELIKSFFRGLKKILRLFLRSFGNRQNFEEFNPAIILPFVDRVNLVNPGQLPNHKQNFITWVARQGFYEKGQKVLVHVEGYTPRQLDRNLYVDQHYFPPLQNWMDRLGYCLSCFKSVFQAICVFRKSAWAYCYLLDEIVELEYYTRSNIAPRLVIFSNQNFQFRPLWTYQFERSGGEVSYAFYSRNSQVISQSNQDIIHKTPGYATMSWPKIFVWDRGQEQFIKSAMEANGLICPEPAFEVCGYIDFNDDGSEIVGVHKQGKSCAIFDVSAFQSCVSADRGIMDPYYRPEVVNQFLSDTFRVFTGLGFEIYYKRKRPFQRIAATAYKRHVEDLLASFQVNMVASSVAPGRLIDHCDIVVSIPYTSTASIGASKSKPSVYYDPTGVLPVCDDLAAGCTVLRGIRELEGWARSIDMQTVHR
jgi:polysaccharide biosynthesis PFTS motif protein